MKKSLRDIQSVLILGTENIIVLPVIRALGRLLPNAKLFTQSPIGTGRPVWSSSKYITDHYYFYSTKEPDKIRELISCIEQTKADIIIPADENYVRCLAKHKKRINKFSLVPPLPSPTQFDRLVNKDKLNEFLIENYLPHANNYRLDDSRLNSWDLETTPLLLKSIRGSSGTGIKKINSTTELHEIIKNLNPEKYFLQEEIDGEIIDCSFLAVDGDVKAYTIQKNLAKDGYNFSTAMEFINHTGLYEITRKVVELSGYSGLANLDYCLDKKDGQPKLIDFNARFWVSISASKAAGIDFTKLYCLATIGHSIDKHDYKNCSYLMGKSAIKHYKQKVMSPFSKNNENYVHTDFWDRISDPEPEIQRFMSKRFSK